MSEPARRSAHARTPSFVTEIPLRTPPAIVRHLTVRLDVARQLYNACLGEALRRLALLRQSRGWQAARRLPRGTQERAHAFQRARVRYGFTDAALQRYAVRVFRASGWMPSHLDGHVVQTLGRRAWRAARQVALGRARRVRFKGPRQLDTVEGKWNRSGLRWRGDHVEWLGLRLAARLPRGDAVVAHALGARVKYVRLVRRKAGARDRFVVQLVCEGAPYRKPGRAVGEGEVGLDLGPSTLAVVGDTQAFLVRFCEEVVRQHRVIRRWQRRLDRQRRAANPGNYLPDGRVRPGPKRWERSRRQRRTDAALAALFRREAAHRRTLHGRLANRVLAAGRVVKAETLPYRVLQRRYGRSVGVRGPGLFMAILRRKAASAGGRVIEFPTRTTKLSQTCHCGTVRKKPLSQRVHACACGVTMHRDLYSAFLARCVGEDNRLDAGLAHARWPGAEPLLRAAWSRSPQPANGRAIPPSSSGAVPPEAERVARGRRASQGRGPGCCSGSPRTLREPGRGGGGSLQNPPALAVGRFSVR